jgi:dTDP-4-amino-4,6-dideoxygalactose transaminase
LTQSYSEEVEIPSWPQATERESELLRAVLDSPQWGGFHPFVTEFEESFAAYQHCDYGISAFNGTVTLELALAVLGIGAGDEVIVPSVSFVSTATAVSRAGAVPVFVDIEPYSFNIDPNRAAEAITLRTRAIIAVHFGGAVADVDSLLRLADRHGIFLIEDAAHAHGSEWNRRRAGSFGICGSFSFQNGKVLCAGEGGMLVTNDRTFADKARAFANQGRKPGESYHKHFTLGTNFRMTGFQAAVLIAQFESLPEQIARRTENAALLKTLLEDRQELIWQKQPEQVTQNPFYLLPARLEDASVSRDDFCKTLDADHVPCAPFYPFPLYRNPLYQEGSPCRVFPCPNAEAYVKDAFWLPHRVLLAEKVTLLELAQTIRRTLEISQAAGI